MNHPTATDQIPDLTLAFHNLAWGGTGNSGSETGIFPVKSEIIAG